MFEQLQATLPRLHRKLPGRLLYSLSSLSVLLVTTLACSTFTNGQVSVSSSAQLNLARLKSTKPTGAERYRLQIARDDRFNDVLFDGIVSGKEYLVKDSLKDGSSVIVGNDAAGLGLRALLLSAPATTQK